MSEISKSDLGIIEERLPVVIDQFENFNHIGSGTFSKVYVANIKVGFNLNTTQCGISSAIKSLHWAYHIRHMFWP